VWRSGPSHRCQRCEGQVDRSFMWKARRLKMLCECENCVRQSLDRLFTMLAILSSRVASRVDSSCLLAYLSAAITICCPDQRRVVRIASYQPRHYSHQAACRLDMSRSSLTIRFESSLTVAKGIRQYRRRWIDGLAAIALCPETIPCSIGLARTMVAEYREVWACSDLLPETPQCPSPMFGESSCEHVQNDSAADSAQHDFPYRSPPLNPSRSPRND
jgi:hypothetical protein